MDAVVEAIPGSELTVERVRTEVRALTERIAAKQWEVQLMVGSRYHELIDSADSVVSMYRSCKRLQLSLGDLKDHFQTIGQIKPAAQLPPPDDRKFAAGSGSDSTVLRSDVLFMLHAPTEIWSCIDRRELLPATRAYLRAKRIAAAASAIQAAGDEALRRVQNVVLRQWACVSDLSKAIKDGVHDLLGSQDVVSTEAHAAGLGALCLVQGLTAPEALAVYLESRSRWLHDDLSTIESLDGDVATVQLKLTRSVQALSRTLVDAYRIFATPHLSKALMLDDVALPSVGRAAVAEAVTQWLARHLEETYRRSQAMLKLVRTSHELAKVRQALWTEARAAAEKDASLWKEACSSLILMDRIRSSLSRALSMSLPFSNTSGAALDLWAVLFSRSFAVLAEDLLSEALAKVKTSLVQQLESVLVTIRAEQQQRGGRLTAVEMAWAAEHMGRNLTAQVEAIGRQADSLVQEGDSHASGALAVSLRTQTLRLLAHVVAYLRVLATSLAEDEQVDGLLIEVRLAWYLSRHLGASSVLDEVPAGAGTAAGQQGPAPSLRSSSARGEATIDFVQLESAFTIADTRDAGLLSQEELKDALDTIGLGGSDGGMPSCTLAEFALLCSPVLEERRPSRFLREALEAVFRQGLAAWAGVAVKHLAEPLHSGAASMAGHKGAMTDALWRSRHAGWEEKLLLQEDEAGATLEDRVWLPTQVSPWLSVFLFSLSAELSRVTQSRDCLEPGLGAVAEEEASSSSCLMEAFRHALVQRARAEVDTCLRGVKPAGLCEAAVLQCTLDHLFLRHWLLQQDTEEAMVTDVQLPGWSALQQQLDPINYQMHEPALLDAVRAQSAASALLLTFLLQRAGPPGRAGLPAGSHTKSLSSSTRRAKSLSDDLSRSSTAHHQGGGGSNSIPLVTAVPRFSLLPVVVEASTPASTRLSSPPRDAHHHHKQQPGGSSAFGFNFPGTDGGGTGGKGSGAAGGVGHAATVLSSFSSLSALGNQAASTATSFLSRATSSNKRS